jgi:glycosyltransferase involved in cell wall biosynthesis
MIRESGLQEFNSIVVFTAAPGDMALVAIRISGPAKFAGVQVLQGKDGDNIFPELVRSAELVVIQRDFPRFWSAYKNVVFQARIAEKPVVYEIDDLLFDLPADHSHHQEYVEVLVPMLSAVLNADLVTVSTPELLEFTQKMNPNTWMIQNYLDDGVWEFRQPMNDTKVSGPVIIGYMGGETHQLDLQEVAPTLQKILEASSGNITLRIWGGKPPSELLNSSLVEWNPINQLNYEKFTKYFISQKCDLFIAPLRDNPFNRAKSGLKFLEYSALSIPGVYSRLPAYERVIDHGVNGFLADTPENWERFLLELIHNPQIRFRMGQQAQKTVKDHWLLSENYKDWYNVYLHAWDRFGEKKDFILDLDQVTTILDQAYTYQQGSEQYYKDLSEQINEILVSRSWKAFQFLQSLRLKFLPKGSEAEKLLYRILGDKSQNNI